MRLLVIEDDANHAQFIVEGLRQAGHIADLCGDGPAGLARTREDRYDVLIVDRMIPGLDGLTVIETLRAAGDKTPALILSSLSHVEERIKGLKAGADDYLSKPFEFGELMARVEALARRGGTPTPEQTRLILADLDVNLLTREVTRAGRKIDLQAKEFQLLEFLMRRAGSVVTRAMLLEGVWNFHFNPNTNLIDAQMSKLRSKVDAKEFGRPLIHTIRGAGYKISAHDEA